MPGVRLVDNPAYDRGNLHSVEAALARHGEGSFLLTNCDHVFPETAATRIAEGSGVTAYCEFERAPEPDAMKVDVDGPGALLRIAKSLTAFDGCSVGLTRVAGEALGDYRRALTRKARRDRSPKKPAVLSSRYRRPPRRPQRMIS